MSPLPRPRRVLPAPVLLVLVLLLPGSPACSDEFLRGDSNTDGVVNIADAAAQLEALFTGGVVYCASASDCNDDGSVDLSDPIFLLAYLFSGGPAPPSPFPECGESSNPNSLGCASHAHCTPGSAIPGLSVADFHAFLRGQTVMARSFTPAEGLGPLFNTVSCIACHNSPVNGGSAPRYRNFYLAAQGPLGLQTPVPGAPSLVLPSYHTDPSSPRVPLPDSSLPGALPLATAQRNAPPLFGVGLFEFVSDAEIISNADPFDLDGDGISGRFNTDGFGNIGRFGYKLQSNFLESFLRGAAFNQMGITTDPILGSAGVVNYGLQVSAGFDLTTVDADGAPDPELAPSDLADLIAFNLFLAPPPSKPRGSLELEGEGLFHAIGCAQCHVESLASAVGPLVAYTDLLLHDMGPDLADMISLGLPQPDLASGFQTGAEFRTQPLWGVAASGPWLHDGRADSLVEAIQMHGGEGADASGNFSSLSVEEQLALIAFLNSL